MREEVKTDATMKTFIHGLFIYICLITIHRISGIIHNNNKNNDFNISNVVLASQYVKNCIKFIPEVTKLQTQLNAKNTDHYLCIGIIDAVNRINKSKFQTPLNASSFESVIKSSLNATKTNRDICSAMNEVLVLPSYHAMTKIDENKNVVELNKYLYKKCDRICFDYNDLYNPLCAVLLWANHVLAQTEAPLNVNERLRNSHAPDDESKGTSTAAKVPSQSSSNNSTIPALSNSTKAHDLTTGNVKQTGIKLKIPDIKSQEPDEKSVDSGASKNASAKNQQEPSEAEHLSEMEHFDIDLPESETAIVVPKEPKHEDKLKLKTDPNLSKTQEIHTTKAVKNVDKLTDDGKKILSIINDNDGGTIDDAHHELPADVPQPNDSTPNEPKDYLTQPDQAVEPPHGGDEEKPNGNGEATKEDIEVSQDNGLLHSGQPEPPQHFFAYFMGISLICLICYIGCHKKQKIMAMIFEGRKSRGGRGRRRPNTAGYRKLDCNLEEAVTSQCNSNVTHVIY